MHMADALVSPAVGGALWAATAGLFAWCGRRLKSSVEGPIVPLMGVLGAFVFASQMINFAIPGTGSSGHLGGGLLLAILLGPEAALVVLSSVLATQALFFADGGLLALGANILNLGFLPAFIAYPFLYRPLSGGRRSGARAWAAALLSAVAGLQLGALGVVLETRASGISALPFSGFLLLMLPIHFAIGLVEGLVTAAVVSFVARARPEAAAPADFSKRSVLAGLLIGALGIGGVGVWFASDRPDGLEWSIAKMVGREDLPRSEESVHQALEKVQEATSVLPDYALPSGAPHSSGVPEKAQTSLAGVAGGGLTLLLAGAAGLFLQRRRS